MSEALEIVVVTRQARRPLWRCPHNRISSRLGAELGYIQLNELRRFSEGA